MDPADLRRIAETHVPEGLAIDEARVLELREGQLFPFRAATSGTPDPLSTPVGCNGVIVNKITGKALRLGSAFPIARDAAMYDRGYRFDRYDLVVTEVRHPAHTVETLRKIAMTVVEPTYEQGTVWRIPRPMTNEELRARLARVPCVFGNVRLYAACEALEAAREAGAFVFELLEYRAPR